MHIGYDELFVISNRHIIQNTKLVLNPYAPRKIKQHRQKYALIHIFLTSRRVSAMWYSHSRQVGTAFHINWNIVPYHLECRSILCGTQRGLNLLSKRAYQRENNHRETVGQEVNNIPVSR